MLQLPDPHYPTLVYQIDLPYSRSYSDWASDVYDGNEENRIVWMRGATYLRWCKSGYWDGVWDRFLQFYKITILNAKKLYLAKKEFLTKANNHLKRKPPHRCFRTPGLRATPGELGGYFGFGKSSSFDLRYLILNGRIELFDGYYRVKVGVLLYRQFKRIEKETA